MTDVALQFTTRREYNLENHYQLREAAGLFLHIAARAYGGRLAPAWLVAERPHDWTPEIDGRSAEAKALRLAERRLLDALTDYDAARLAAVAKAKDRRRT